MRRPPCSICPQARLRARRQSEAALPRNGALRGGQTANTTVRRRPKEVTSLGQARAARPEEEAVPGRAAPVTGASGRGRHGDRRRARHDAAARRAVRPAAARVARGTRPRVLRLRVTAAYPAAEAGEAGTPPGAAAV